MTDDAYRKALCALRECRPMIIIGPRPGRRSLQRLKDLQLTHICSLLHAGETPEAIGTLAGRIGCQWIWLPIAGGHLEALRTVDLPAHVIALQSALADTPHPRIYLHCSAGIHRTGFFACALLRLLGRSKAEALCELQAMRDLTAEQVGPERLALAEEMIAGILHRP